MIPRSKVAKNCKMQARKETKKILDVHVRLGIRNTRITKDAPK